MVDLTWSTIKVKKPIDYGRSPCLYGRPCGQMVDHVVRYGRPFDHMVDHTNKVVDHNLLADHRLWSTTNGYGRQFVVDQYFRVYLPRKLGIDAIFRCKLTIQSRYKEVSEKIHRYLNNNERTHFFEQSAFGNLVSSSDDLWMVVCKRPVRFSLLEYCLITGLDCAIEPEDLSDRDVFGTTHFPGKSEIALSDLEGKIIVEEQNETGIDVEKIKMASLYFGCAVFGEATRKKTMKIDPKYLRLVDDLDRFNHYPWGRVAYRYAVRCLKKDLLGRYNYLTDAQGRKEVDGSFLVGGFVMPLQILAYECYPRVAQKVARRRDVEGLMLPRMFQWVTNTWSSNRAPNDADIAAAFGCSPIDDCLGFFTPTPEELVSPYYTTGCSSSRGKHTFSANASQDVSGTRSGDLNRFSSSTSSPMRTGPRVHFGLNPSRHPSPLEHRFERRLTALEDSVASMHVKMSAEFIETRASIRNINMTLDDLKSSFNLGLDELRSSLTKQIRTGFGEIRSNMLVHQDKDYSIAYSRGRKRKSSEADFGVDDSLAREIGSSSQTQHIFEPNLPVITEESSEDIQVTPDARMSGGEATTSRGYYTTPCLFIFSLKLL
ncbi:uncharacterized protein [Primulina huaijiensis]|uniref:uncharacterized protein n=1 Tax=Primulina huaijiensis TaxID=1492673 RepID=UPI003CC7833E